MSSPYSNPHTELSSSQARFVYWLNGLAPVATNIVTPLIVYWNMKKQPHTLVSKYNVQVNEVVRQLISGTIGLVSYFGGGELTRALVNKTFDGQKNTLDDATKQVAMITGGVVASFIGFAFVRPYASTELICKFLKREEGVAASFSEQTLRTILDEARIDARNGQGKSMATDMISRSQVFALLEKEKAAQIAQQAGVKSKHWLMAPVQRWVDRHLVPNGQPDLVRVVRYSSLALTGYLTALTLGLWGLNRLLGKPTPAQRNRQPLPHPALLTSGNLPDRAALGHPMMMGARPAVPRLGLAQCPMTPWRPPVNGLTQLW